MPDVMVLIRQLQGFCGRRARGSSAVTFPGGSPSATVKTIAHGLGVIPTSIHLQRIGTLNIELQVLGGVTTTDQTFQVGGATADGSSPVAGTQNFFYWEAAG